MQLGEAQKVWLNPMSDINYKNYEEGMIRSFRLGFQDPEWYKQNKDNFCTSLRENFPDLVPYYISKDPDTTNPVPHNFLGFYPDEIIRYGKLEKATMKIDEKVGEFWVVKIPAGLHLYHSSRSLGLNHSEFPIRGYDNELTLEENQKRVFIHCPSEDFIGHKVEDVINNGVCTYVSYYSNPYVTREYLRKGQGFGADQIRYAYGTDQYSEDPTYNDRLKTQADENFYGVQAYTLDKDTYFVIFALDDFLIERPDLGRKNMRTFKKIMKYLEPVIKRDMKVTNDAFVNFMDLIDSVTGIGTLADNARMIMKDYPQAKNFDKGLWNWLITSASVYTNSNTRSNTAGYIRYAAAGISKGIDSLDRYKGLRFSTYEHDRPVMNMLGWMFGTYPTFSSSGKQISVYGFVSSSVFGHSKGGDSTIKSKPYTRLDLQYYIPNGTFHSEAGMFYAPDVLYRDRDNKFDLEYSINYEGITQELRKYKTTNLMHYRDIDGMDGIVDGFHQGHLMEHSTWVGIIAPNLIKDEVFEYFVDFIDVPRDIYLIAGYFHDIGKSGECEQTAVYKGMDPQNPVMSVCDFVTRQDSDGSSSIVGMKYYDIPEHPEKGYEYLKGYKTYNKFTLRGTDNINSYRSNAISVYLEDWDAMFEELDLDTYTKRLVRIAVGSHWYFGDAVRKMVVDGIDNQTAIEDFVSQVELFHNDEFFRLDPEKFLAVLIFVIVISIADIIGSEYSPTREPTGLNGDKRATLINYLPNISFDNIDPYSTQPIVNQIIDYALTIQKRSPFKRGVIKSIRENTELILDGVYKIMDQYEFNRANNYSLLYNLVESYPKVSDIKRAYGSKFPKIIAFDLDQTMFAIKFHPNAKSTYYIYPETYDIMKEVQLLRKKYFPNDPTYIAVTSRHYSPRSLLDLIKAKDYEGKPNPLYYKNFDYIISRYTGPKSKIESDMSGVNNFFQYNGSPDDGFVLDTDDMNYATIPNNSPTFPDLNKISKHGHFNVLKRRYGVEYSDILTFDDDEKYFTEKGLGPAKDVYAAGVLRARLKEDQGIRMSLFKKGVAYYVFDRIIDEEE